jgi:hypothetical protein
MSIETILVSGAITVTLVGGVTAAGIAAIDNASHTATQAAVSAQLTDIGRNAQANYPGTQNALQALAIAVDNWEYYSPALGSHTLNGDTLTYTGDGTCMKLIVEAQPQYGLRYRILDCPGQEGTIPLQEVNYNE